MLIIIIIVVAAICYLYIRTYNKFVRFLNQAKNASSSVDIMLKKRFDLIPQLLDVAKGYAKHEREVLEQIEALRSKPMNEMSHSEKDDAADLALNVTRQIVATIEQYPELRSSDHFMHLQRTMVETEEQLSAARRFHNSSVTAFNNLSLSFPTNIVAKMNGFKTLELYKFQ